MSEAGDEAGARAVAPLEPGDLDARPDASDAATGAPGALDARPDASDAATGAPGALDPRPDASDAAPGAPTDEHADLEFPGDAPPPPASFSPEEADREAARVADAVARNARATGSAAVVGFLVATAAFFGIAYAFPESERGFSLVVVALALGAFAGVAVWALARSKAPVFDPGPLAPDLPVDEATRRYEARAREHEGATRRAFGLGAATFVLVGPVALYAWWAHLDALNETRGYFEQESVGAGRGAALLAVAIALGALVTRVLRPSVDVLAELGGLPPGALGREPRAAALSKADLDELRAIAGEVRARQRREAFAHGGAVVGLLGTAVLVTYLGGGLFFGIVAGVLVAYAISRAGGNATPVPRADVPSAPDRGRDHFAESLGSSRSFTLEVPGDLESLAARFLGVAVNRWTLLDDQNAQLAEAMEDDAPLWRRLLPFRPRQISFRDLDRTPLVLQRAAGPIDRGWRVIEHGAPRGLIAANFLGTLVLHDEAGVERFRVRRSWLSWRSRVVLSGQKEVARMEWPRSRAFASVLDRPGLIVGVPEGASLADRRLLVAAGLVLDLDRM